MFSLLSQTLLHPFLHSLSLAPPPADPTFGRYLLPLSPNWELSTIYAEPGVRVRHRRVWVRGEDGEPTGEEGEDVELKQEELDGARGRQWISYQIWEKDPAPDSAPKADLIFVHGIGDYSSKWAPHSLPFLRSNYRIIALDLPAHGRSTGLHVYLPDCERLAAAIHAVAQDAHTEGRRAFLVGHSLGGFSVLYYASRYSPSPSTSPSSPTRPPIAGIYALSPMLSIASSTRPSKAMEYLARLLALFGGRVPLSPPVLGTVSDDPEVDREYWADERCYHGWLRIGTGLALLRGIDAVIDGAGKIAVPVRIAHGTGDRVCDFRGSVAFMDLLRTHKKEIKLFPDLEHVLLKPGVDAADDEPRQMVLRDLGAWLEGRLGEGEEEEQVGRESEDRARRK